MNDTATVFAANGSYNVPMTAEEAAWAAERGSWLELEDGQDAEAEGGGQ